MSAISRRGVLAGGASALLAGCGFFRDRMANIRIDNHRDQKVQVQLTASRASSSEVVLSETLTLEPGGDWVSESLESDQYEVTVRTGDREQSGRFPLTDSEAVFVDIRADGIEFMQVAA